MWIRLCGVSVDALWGVPADVVPRPPNPAGFDVTNMMTLHNHRRHLWQSWAACSRVNPCIHHPYSQRSRHHIHLMNPHLQGVPHLPNRCLAQHEHLGRLRVRIFRRITFSLESHWSEAACAEGYGVVPCITQYLFGGRWCGEIRLCRHRGRARIVITGSHA